MRRCVLEVFKVCFIVLDFVFSGMVLLSALGLRDQED